MLRQHKQKVNIAYNNIRRLILSVVLVFVYIISFAVFVLPVNQAQATIPKYINFQGKLTIATAGPTLGTNVANGTYAFEFKIYDAVSAGSLLWTETWDGSSGSCPKLTVTNGVFNAKLGACNSLSSLDFTGGSLYMTINFAPTGTSYDGEMSPRKQLVSSAYAFVANGVSGDGAINTVNSSATALSVAKSGSNYALQVDTSTASAATGLKVTSAAAAGGLALNVISSGTDESLTLNAKGAGTVSIGGSSTGDVLLGGGSGSTGCTITNSTGAFACTASVKAPYVYGGDMTTTYAGYQGGVFGGSATHGVLDFVDNGSRIGEFYTTSSAFNFFSDTSKGINFYVNNSFTNPAIGIATSGAVGIQNSSPTALLTLGTAGTTAGTISMAGGTSGTVTLQTQAIAGTYNFNLPTTAGSSGYVLTSGGGGSTAMTWTDPSGLGVRWNAIAAPTGSLSLAHGSNTTAFTFNGVTTGAAFGLSSSSLSTGTLLDLAVTGTAGASSQKALNVSTSGTITGTQTTYGGYFSNTHSSGTSTNIGLYSTATGGTNNYAAIFDQGNVGIGTTTPTNLSGTYFGATQLNPLWVSANDAAKVTAAVIQGNLGEAIQFVDQTGTAEADFGVYTTDLYFVNRQGSGAIRFVNAADTAMFIASNGNVGVGTSVSAPNARLEVKGASGQRTTLIGDAGYGTNYAGLSVQGTFASNSYSLLGDGTNLYANRPTGGNIEFRENNSTQVTLLTGGNFGVGDSSPAALLTVGSGDLFQVNSSGAIAAVTGITSTGATNITVNSATALTVAQSGSNYALQVDTSTASSATGLKLTSAAAGAGVSLGVISSGTNEALTVNSKGTGAINIGSTSTGNINIGSSGTGDVLLGGGNSSTGCTVTNTTGAFTCTANGAFGTQLSVANGSASNSGGVLAVTTTSSSDFVPGIKNTYTQSATGTLSAGYGLQNLVASTSVVAGVGVGQNLYGEYNTASKSGADTATGTYNTYATYNSADNTGRTNVGTVNTYGGYFSALGDTAGTSTTYGVYATVSGADNNYAGIFQGGNVGIGDSTPLAALTVGSGDLFQVNSSGAIAAATGITSSGTINFSGLTASSAVYTDASKNLTSTAPTSGALGYWSRSGATLSPTTAGDNVTTTGNISTTSTGTITSAGLLTGSAGITISGGTANINASGTSATNIGNSTGALTVASGSTSAWTNTAGNLTISTATSGTLAVTSAGSLNLTSASTSTYALQANAATSFRFTDGTNAYQTINTQTGTSGVSAFTWTPGTAPSIASAAGSTYNAFTFTPGTQTYTGTTNTTATGTSAPLGFLLNQLSIAGSGTRSITEASTAIINGAVRASSSSGTETITAAYGLNILAGSALNGTNGAVTRGYGLAVNAPTGATTNYAAVFSGGNVGIGTTTPSYTLDVGGAARLQNVMVGYSAGNSTIQGATGGGGIINLQNSASESFTFTSTASTSADVFVFNATPSSTTQNLFQIQKNASAVIMVDNNGKLGIGDSTPLAALTVGSGDLFQVNSSGAIAAATGITSSGTIAFSGLSSNGPVYTTGGTGTLTTTAPTSGAIGYWSRSGTTLSATTANDVVSIATTNTTGADLAITNTGAYTGTGIFNLTANNATSGKLLSINSNGTGALTNQTGLSVSLQGAVTGAQTTYGAQISNTHSGASAINYALQLTASGASGANYALVTTAGSVSINTGNVILSRTDTTASFQIQGGNSGASQNGDFSINVGGASREFAVVNNNTSKYIFFVPGGSATGNSNVGVNTTSPGNYTQFHVVQNDATASQTRYSIYGEATGAGATSTNIAGYFTATGATNNYAAIFDQGNVGIGDTTPNSLFTVGSGDLFQINSSGQIGSQQAPVSDYLFALAGNTTNNNSRIIDITQANNSAEDSDVIKIVNTAAPGSGSRSVTNLNLSLTPTAATASLNDSTFFGIRNTVSAANISVAGGSNSSTIYGTYNAITSTPTFNSASGSDAIVVAGGYSSVLGAPVLTSVTAASTYSTYGEYIVNGGTSAGNANLTATAYGVYAFSNGNLTTTGSTSHYAGYFSASGSAVNNYGLWVDSSSGTNNYAAIFNTGNVGIGDSTPLAALTVGSGDLFQVNSSGAIAAATGITSSGTINFSGLTASSAVYTDASKNLTSTAPTSGAIGYWSRSGTTLSATTANDVVSIATTNTTGADLAITNTGAYTGTGIFNLTANTATTGTLAAITGNALTNGSLLSLSSSSAAATTGQKGLSVALTGALTGAQTTYGGYFSNTRTGASAINVGLYSTASGATGANYAAIFDQGNVGIGTTAPAKTLQIQSALQLYQNGGESRIDAMGTQQIKIIGVNTTNSVVLLPNISSGSANFSDNSGYIKQSFATSGNATIGTIGIDSTNNFFLQPGAGYNLQILPNGTATTSLSGAKLVNTITSSTASIVKSGLEVQSTGTWNGASASNIGLYISSVTGGTNNYDAIFNGGGNVGVNTTSPTQKLMVSQGNIKAVGVQAPTITAATPTTGGSLATNNYYYAITAVDATGESSPTYVYANVTGGNNKVNLSWTSSPLATSYNIYRSAAGPAGPFVSYNTASTSYGDTGAAGGSSTPPVAGTAYGRLQSNMGLDVVDSTGVSLISTSGYAGAYANYSRVNLVGNNFSFGSGSENGGNNSLMRIYQQFDLAGIDNTYYSSFKFRSYYGDTASFYTNPRDGVLYLQDASTTNRFYAYPGVADGASAVAYTLDTTNALSNATAKLLEIRNQGSAKLTVLANGNTAIGTTSTSSKLEVDNSDNTNYNTYLYNSGGTGRVLRLNGGSGANTPLLSVESASSAVVQVNAPGSTNGVLYVTTADNTNFAAVISNSPAGSGRALKVVSGSTTANIPILQADNNSGTVFGIYADGKVGIGTTGPDRKLDVLDASNPQMRLTYTDGSVYSDFQTDSSGYLKVTPTGNRTIINGTNYALATGNANLIINSTDSAAANLGGSLGFAQSGTTYALISGRTDGAGGNPGYMSFETRNGSNVVNEAMRIASTSRIGINTSTTTNGWVTINNTSGGIAGLRVDQAGGPDGGTTYGVYAAATGSATNSGTYVGGYFSSSVTSAGHNYGLIVNQGDVGINTTSPTSKLDIGSSDFGNGAAGPVITLGRNNNGTATGAGSINFQSKAGTAGYVWQDNAGNLRINTAAPTNANDTAGTVIGTQTSTRNTKQDIHDYTDYAAALQMVADAPLHTFKYIKDVQGYGANSPLAKDRIGYIADEVPADFMWGNSIDQVSVNGILMASVKQLNNNIISLTDHIAVTGNGNVQLGKNVTSGTTTVDLGGASTNNAVCHSTAGGTDDQALVDCSAAPVADYAENYPVEAGSTYGDLMAIGTEMVPTYDTTNGSIDWNKLKGNITKLVKTTGAYQATTVGVVSDNYGDFTSAGHNIKPQDNPMPIALVGRVPVKVTTENGPIVAGDFLTSSATVPGAAMKATKAGPVIGQALASYSGDGVGKVLTFIKVTNYSGADIAKEMPGLQFNYSDPEVAATNSTDILNHLLDQLPHLDTAHLSQVNTDVVIAGGEVVTPTVTTHTLRTDLLSSATSEGGLSVASSTIFNGGLKVDTIGSIGTLLSIESDVEFFGIPYFTADTAGFAVVKTGVQSVDVTFTHEYLAQPIVSASISFEQDVDQSNLDDAARGVLKDTAVADAQAFMNDPVSFVITNKSKFGFTIVLSKPASRDIKLSWIALAVRNASTFMSLDAPENPSVALQDTGSIAGSSTDQTSSDQSTSTSIDSSTPAGDTTTPSVPTDSTTPPSGGDTTPAP